MKEDFSNKKNQMDVDDILSNDSDFDADMDYDFSGDYDSDVNTKISRVYDELADLKKLLGSSEPARGGYYPHGMGEVALYNEIGRLREELAKTQSNQSLQQELGRIRNEMEYSAKRNDEKIRGLIEKVQSQIGAIEESSKKRDGAVDLKDASDGAGKIAIGDPEKLSSFYGQINELLNEKSEEINFKLDELKELIASNASSIDPQILDSINSGMEKLREEFMVGQGSDTFIGLKKAQRELISSVNQVATDVRRFNETGSLNLTSILMDLDTVSNKLADQDRAISELGNSISGVEKIKQVSDTLDEFIQKQTGVVSEERAQIIETLDNIKLTVDKLSTQRPIITANLEENAGDGLNLLLSEIVSLRDELQTYKDEISSYVEKSAGTDGDALGDAGVAESIAALRADIAELIDRFNPARYGDDYVEGEAITPVDEPEETLAGDSTPKAEETKVAPTSSISPEIAELKNTINQLRGEVAELKANKVDASDLKSGLDEVKSILSNLTNAPSSEGSEQVRSDIAEIKLLIENLGIKHDENAAPFVTGSEYGVILAEIKALRSEIAEIKAMKSDAKELSAVKDAISSIKDEPDYAVMNEVLALRDEFQMMKDGMALLVDKLDESGAVAQIKNLRDQIFAINMVNISNTEEPEYESYNNLILDAIGFIRDDIDAISNNISSESGEKKEDKLSALITELEGRIKEAGGANKAELLTEIDSLKKMNASGLETSIASLDLLSRIAKILDDQSNYLADIKENEKKAGSADYDQLRGEVADLKKSVEGGAADEDFESSIRQLKDELSQMAGLVKEEPKPAKKVAAKKTTAKKAAAKKKPAKKSASKKTK